MNKGDSLFVVSVRVSVLVSLRPVSGPSSMSDSNTALVLAFDALCKFLKTVSSISAFLSVLCDYYVLGASLQRSHST